MCHVLDVTLLKLESELWGRCFNESELRMAHLTGLFVKVEAPVAIRSFGSKSENVSLVGQTRSNYLSILLEKAVK